MTGSYYFSFSVGVPIANGMWTSLVLDTYYYYYYCDNEIYA